MLPSSPTSHHQSDDCAVGQIIGDNWRIEGRLGQGGMGIVYLAHDLALGRKVAIKVLADHLTDDPAGVARFEREAQLTAQLEHPNIVTIYNVGRASGRPFIVMKLLEGMSLRKYLGSLPGPMSLNEVLEISRQICAGLDFIHRKGFVHRDVKPSNIFLGPDGHATLLDFGILHDPHADFTRAGVRLGTPTYMAPEQEKSKAIDGRADVFAYGIVLARMLAGAAFDITGTLQGPTLRAKELCRVAPWIAPPVARVLERATAESPGARFATAPALLDALEKAAQDPTSRKEAPIPEAVTESVSSDATSSAKGSFRAASWVLAGVAAVGIALAVFWVMEPEAPKPAPNPTTAAPTLPSPAQAPASAQAQEMPPKVRESPPSISPEPTRTPVRTREAPPPKAKRVARREPQRAKTVDPGELRVITRSAGAPTWARVVVDGQHRGSTPIAIEVAPGTHVVRVQRDGFRPEERTVQVASGKRVVLRVDLEP